MIDKYEGPWGVIHVCPRKSDCFVDGHRVAYQSIQEAVSKLPRGGGVVIVSPGRYYHSSVKLPRRKHVVIVGGSDCEHFLGDSPAAIIGSCGSSATIVGMTFRGRKRPPPRWMRRR